MAKELVEQFILKSRVLRSLHPLSRAEYSAGLKPSVTVNELMGSPLNERDGMNIGTSRIYTATTPLKGGGVEIMSIVDTKLAGMRLINFLDQFAPVKFYHKPDSWQINPLYDVGTDWAYMASILTEGQHTRTVLDDIHAKIPGFKQFIPHAPEWVKALGLPILASSYLFTGPQKALMPVMHFTVTPDLKVAWKDDVITYEEKMKIAKVFSGYPELSVQNFETVDLDRMLGMCMPPYIHPEMSRHWPKEVEIKGKTQTMMAAQMPVLNFMRQRENGIAKPFVRNLVSLAK